MRCKQTIRFSECQEGELTHLSPCSAVAKCIESPMPPVDGQNLLEHEGEEKSAAGTEDSIMDLKKEGELLWLTCLHNFANAEDGG